MHLELDGAMATIFWQSCFAKFGILRFLLSKLFLSFCYFYNIRPSRHYYSQLEVLSLSLLWVFDFSETYRNLRW